MHWRVVPGDFEIMVGKSSEDLPLNSTLKVTIVPDATSLKLSLVVARLCRRLAAMALQICDDDIGEIVFDLVGKWVCLGLVSTLGECLPRRQIT